MLHHYDAKIFYNYTTDGRLAGNINTQKKIAGEAGNYVVVNYMLSKFYNIKKWKIGSLPTTSHTRTI